MLGRDEINHRIGPHALSREAITNVHNLRAMVAGVMANADHLLPDSREKDLAMQAFEEALMWANKAISRHQSAVTVDVNQEGMPPVPESNLQHQYLAPTEPVRAYGFSPEYTEVLESINLENQARTERHRD